MASSNLLLKHFPSIQLSTTTIKTTSSSFPTCSSSSSSSSPPPSSRQEAILQAKTSLSTTLHKPLNNPLPIPSKKLKKQRQPRYRVEIPILDNSPDSLVQLTADLLLDLPLTLKGTKPTILILWPSSELADSAHTAFNSSKHVLHSDFASLTSAAVNTADILVFSAPEASQLEELRRITNEVDPRPVVLFNPAWAFDDEKDDQFGGGGLSTFVGSFDVVYSFLGLEVRGILSKRKGVVFRCVKDGVVSGEEWLVMVEQDNNGGELKVVSRFKRRPAIAEVENVLYNLMAATSPVTKSVKFLRDLASSVTGKKKSEIWSPLLPRGRHESLLESHFEFSDGRTGKSSKGKLKKIKGMFIEKKLKKKLKKKKRMSNMFIKNLDFSSSSSTPVKGWRRVLRAAANKFKGQKRDSLQKLLPTL